jgi:hypothetical protein
LIKRCPSENIYSRWFKNGKFSLYGYFLNDAVSIKGPASFDFHGLFKADPLAKTHPARNKKGPSVETD